MIYYVSHWDWVLHRSRSDIVKNLSNKFEICAIVPEGKFNLELKNSYKETINWNYDRKKIIDIFGIYRLRKILKTINQDDTLHIFTLKSLVLYILSSMILNKNYRVMVSITGLGYLFADTKIAKILRIFIKPILRLRINKVVDTLIFQNTDNQNIFTEFSNFKNNVELIVGSGIETNKLYLKKTFNKKLKVIYVGRLLKEKGIFEYSKIANNIKLKNNFEFYVAGELDPGNKSTISKEDFNNLKSTLQYLGNIDTFNDLHNYDILVSPSHHEGFSRIVLEGAYIGLYCIGNNIPGQKEIITNTECGELIDNNDIELYINSFEDIDKKIEKLDFEFTRNQIENNYSVNAISEKFEEIYR